MIAPWFLAPPDGKPPSPSSPLPYLQWDDLHPISHTFRYGAESIGFLYDNDDNDDDFQSVITLSSFAVMDVLLETLCDRERFPNLERIIVAGHSAGGQFVHRWGLSSDSWCFGDGDDVEDASLPKIRLVAANPRSYAYLDGRRYLPLSTMVSSTDEIGKGDPSFYHSYDIDKRDGEILEFRLPTTSERENCPEYNSYEWGLIDNPDVPAPYISSNLNKVMSQNNDDADLFRRYASRDMVYLSGERDTQPLSVQICNQDGYQGPMRRERSERFFSSLQVLGREMLSGYEDDEKVSQEKVKVHSRILVNNVGHDHALMFQSDEGLEGLFK